MYVEANGKVYTFYDHAVARMKRRGIQFQWVETTLREPDDVTALSPERNAYDKQIDTHLVRVIVDEETNEIVTVWKDEDE